MTGLLSRRIIVVWVLLVAATLVSFGLGGGHRIDGARAAGVGLMFLAFVKVRLIGLHFMELRNAPLPLRLLFETWSVVVCGGVLLVYLAG